MKQFKLTPSALFLITFVSGLVLSWIQPWNFTVYMNGTVVRSTGIILLIVSLLLNILAYKEFKKFITPHAPFMKPKVLIKKSIFSLSRNPVYLALILSESGLAFVFDSIWIFVAAGMLWIILDIVIVRPEEKMLENTFKYEYENYKKMTRRWL